MVFLIWATGNAPRDFTRDLIAKVDEQKMPEEVYWLMKD